MNESESVMLGTLREAFGRVAYSHKTHEKMADRIAWATKWLKRVELLLIVLTTGGTLAILIDDTRDYEIVTAILAALALFVTLYQFRFNPDDVGRAHRSTAVRLWHIREKYCALITDLLSGQMEMGAIRASRDKLVDELRSIYEPAPESDSRAYKAAQKALKVGEELSFSETEIDQLLPVSLRTGSHNPPVKK